MPMQAAKLNSNRDPWDIMESAFPRNGTTVEKLRFCVNYASLAPSAHNSQPWLFKVLPDQIELYADLRRALPAVDPNHRELAISCGAALHNLVLALRYFGYHSSVESLANQIILSEESPTVLLARVRVDFAGETGSEERDLFHAIPRRRTSRLPFEPRPISKSFLDEVEEIARAHGAWVQLLQEERQRKSMADFVAQGNRVQISDKKFRDELSAWSASTQKGRRDGMPGYATGASFVLTYAGPFLFRTTHFSDWQARRDRDLVMQAPALLLLGTDTDSPQDWLQAGRALQAIALRASLECIWLAFLNQPIEVTALREYLRKEFSMTGYPQLLIRMGYGPACGHTPRLELKDFLM